MPQIAAAAFCAASMAASAAAIAAANALALVASVCKYGVGQVSH